MADLSDRSSGVAASASSVESRSDWPALAAGLVTVALWGSAFVGIRAAGSSLSPGSIALGRLLVSSAILLAVALLRRESIPRGRALALIAAYGVLWLGVYSITLNAAERLVDAGTAAMLINTGPLLIAILAGLFLREGFPPGLLAGCAVAFVGCVAIGFATTHTASRGALGILLCIVAAVAYASAVVVQKLALATASSFQVTWLGVAAATIACVPFAPALAGEVSMASASSILWTIYLGAFPTALGFATWSFALRRGSAGRTGSLNYLIPVVAIVLGWAVLGEAPPWLALAGGALCVAGVYLARRRPSR
ncbi:MAG TPA: DMT family transporter [Candidatus Dormibacteraeota bacterium]|nr:DMT family transporter [Candidatus Dormibacteraeota bacterium]